MGFRLFLYMSTSYGQNDASIITWYNLVHKGPKWWKWWFAVFMEFSFRVFQQWRYVNFRTGTFLLTISARVLNYNQCGVYYSAGIDCLHWPLSRYVNFRVAHAPRMPGTFSPPPRVSDPDMHHGTCVTHVPWRMPWSLTSGGGENVPAIPGACATRNLTYLARGPCVIGNVAIWVNQSANLRCYTFTTNNYINAVFVIFTDSVMKINTFLCLKLKQMA